MTHYLTFDEVGITVAAIGIAMAFIVLTWNAVKAIKEWIASLKKPENDRINDNEETLEDHERRITHLEECCTEVRGKLDSDWQFQQEEKEFNVLMLESIKQLLKHSLDGNDKDGLKDMENRINLYLMDQLKKGN